MSDFVPEGYPLPPLGRPSLLWYAAVVAFHAGYVPPLRMPQLWDGDQA